MISGQELARGSLESAGAQVVTHSVSRDIIQRICLGNILALSTKHDN